MLSAYLKPIIKGTNLNKDIYSDSIKTDEKPVSQMKWNTCYSDIDLNWEKITVRALYFK